MPQAQSSEPGALATVQKCRFVNQAWLIDVQETNVWGAPVGDLPNVPPKIDF